MLRQPIGFLSMTEYSSTFTFKVTHYIIINIQKTMCYERKLHIA